MDSAYLKIALIEIGGSHDECLYSQMNAIKSAGHFTILVCTLELEQRNPHFRAVVDEFILIDKLDLKLKRLKTLRYIWRNLKRKMVNKVIFNTAQGTNVRILCTLSLFSKIEFIGIIHTIRKFQGSFTQRLISLRIRKYLVLSEYLYSQVTAPKGIRLDWFYPLRFPNFPVEINTKEQDNLKITIIGGVESRRKDLNGFLQMAVQLIDYPVEFVFLGKSDFNNREVLDFRLKIVDSGLNDKVRFYQRFVKQEEFDHVLRNTDLILPLVHPNTSSAEEYFKNQISGAMMISFAYKVPMLIHEAYSGIQEMKSAAIYYNQSDFKATIIENQKKIQQIKATMEANQNYNVAYQENRYISFIVSK